MILNARVTRTTAHEGGGVQVHLFFFELLDVALDVWWPPGETPPAPGSFTEVEIRPSRSEQ